MNLLSWVFKANPFHDAAGKFTTREGNVAKIRAAQDLAASHSPTLSTAQIVDHALPNAVLRDKYLSAVSKQNYAWIHNKTTEKIYRKDGGGYTKERLKLHRAILQQTFEDIQKYLPPEGTKPTMTILGGRGGSGKSNFDKEKNASVGVYSSKTALVLDSDHFKGMLPEYSPDMAAVVHQESADLFKKAVRIARMRGINVVLDVTMRTDASSWVKSFQKSGYRTEAHFMHRPPELAAVAAVRRWSEASSVKNVNGTTTHYDHGRLVPVSVVLDNTDNEKHFDSIAHRVDRWSLYDNSHPTSFVPKKIAEGVRKENPYHDAQGQFTDKEHAVAPGQKPEEGDFHWKKSLQKYKDAVKANIKGVSWYTNKDTTAINTKTGLVEASHTVGMYSAAKTAETVDQFKDQLKEQGFEIVPAGTATEHGQAEVTVSKSLITVKTFHNQKAPEPIPTPPAKPADAAKAIGKVLTPEQKAAVDAEKKAAATLAKQKVQHAKYLAQFHEKAVPLLKSAALLKEMGQNSKAEGEMKKFATALNYLVQYGGATTDDISRLEKEAKAEHKKQYDQVVAAVTASWHKVFKARLESGKGHLDNIEWTVNDSPEYKALTAENPILIQQGQFVKIRQEAAASFKQPYYDRAMAYALAKANDPHSPAVALERESLLKSGFSELTLDSFEKTGALLGDLVKTKGYVLKPKNAEEATKNFLIATEKKAFLHALYYEIPSGSPDNHKAEQDFYAAKKLLASVTESLKGFGVNPNSTSVYSAGQKATVAGVAAGKAYYENTFLKVVNAKKAYKAALDEYYATADYKGSIPDQAEEALKAAHEAALQHVPEEVLTGYKEKAQTEFAGQLAAKKEATKQAIKSTVYEASFNEEFHGYNHPITKSSYAKLHDSVSAMSELFDNAELNSIVESAIASAKSAKEVAKASGLNTANLDAVAASHLNKTFVNPLESYQKKQAFRDFAASQITNLTQGEKGSIEEYTGSLYSGLNKDVGKATKDVISGKTPMLSYSTHTKRLDSALEKTTLGMDVRLNRGMLAKYVWEQLGVDPAKAKYLNAEQLNEYKGRVYRENAFMSTTLKPDFGSGFATDTQHGHVILRINAGKEQKGLYIKSLSGAASEEEVLLPRGSTFLIRSIKKGGSTYNTRWEIEVDLVGHQPVKLY